MAHFFFKKNNILFYSIPLFLFCSHVAGQVEASGFVVASSDLIFLDMELEELGDVVKDRQDGHG